MLIGLIAYGDCISVSSDGSTWEQISSLDHDPQAQLIVGDTLIATYEIDGTYHTWAFDLEQ